jgi:FdhE protein
MPSNPWQARIARAETLAAQHAFVREILSFYVQIAQFQERLYREVQTNLSHRDISSSTLPSPGEVPALPSGFGRFLSVVKQAGPAALRNLAEELQGKGREECTELLDSVWVSLDGSSSSTAQVLARAFLQPYAEFLRTKAGPQCKGYNYSVCPFCSRKPVAGVLRQQGDGAARSLLCGFCLAEWEFRRIVCPACGEEDNRKLPVYIAEQFDYMRVDCCETCRTYLKTVDLTKNGLAEPLVDEIASAPLDLWARDHGYAKLLHNLLGM